MANRTARPSYFSSDHEAFVRAWERSTSLLQVSAQVGMSPKRCSTRAGRLRQMGVQLRHFRKFGRDRVPGREGEINVERLNEIVREERKGG